MAASMLGGAAVGALMSEALKAGLKMIDKAGNFSSTLETSMDTLKALDLLVAEMKQYSSELGRPREEVERLENELKAGKELVEKCIKLPWWRFFTFPRHRDKLVEWDKKLVRRLSVELQARMARDLMETLSKIVRGCKGSPLALEVIGGSMCRQPFEVWQRMKIRLESRSILDYNEDLLARLQNSLDILEDTKQKECFMDLGLFPEDQRIRVPALIDMWTELHELDEDGLEAMNIIHTLTTMNLANVLVTRKIAMDVDMYYNNHFLMQHDLLRELAIHQSNQEGPFEQRKRLTIDLSGGNGRPEWCVGQNHHKGMISRILSFFPIRWMEQQKHIHSAARTLSISTDETFDSEWFDVQADETEVLVLNIRSSRYALPAFIAKMSRLKVLIATGYGFHPSEISNFEPLAHLPNLRRIRLEKVSLPRLCESRSLRRLSLHMCNARQAFEGSAVEISDALPNLAELSIDYCKDLAELPSDLCDVTAMRRLSVTNCHGLSALPRGIGRLQNLEVMRLSCCSKLEEVPESVGDLRKLRCLDVSDCVSLARLPSDIGGLSGLRKLYMWGCSGLGGVPSSVARFRDLEHEIRVVCDEEKAGFWEHFADIPNLKIEMYKADHSLNWLHGARS